MASYKPELVRDVVRKIPNNRNPLVYGNLLDAALAMPADIAATLIDQLITSLASVYQLTLLVEKLGALVSHLARGGRNQETIELAAALLALHVDPNAKTSGSRVCAGP